MVCGSWLAASPAFGAAQLGDRPYLPSPSDSMAAQQVYDGKIVAASL